MTSQAASPQGPQASITPLGGRTWRARVLSVDTLALLVVIAVAALTWLPRSTGPIDLRWDGSVHYILGTSLAEGKGYRLLNEPGEIAAVQYPPLLPAIVAAHQLVLGTSDPWVVGSSLRVTAFLAFIAFAVVALRFLRVYVSVVPALLGALAATLCLDSWFFSDALYPEIGFAIATTLFLMSARRRKSGIHQGLAFMWAVVSYALRTVGIVAFGVFVLDSVLQRRWRQAVGRALLVLVPVLAWQGYVASVERSDAYRNPAYAYQRAAYLFYNVSYPRNIALRDPFTPEKGQVQWLRRIARNLSDIPVSVGEALTIPRSYIEMTLHAALGDGPVVRPVIVWGVFGILSLVAVIVTVGGLAILVLRGEFVVGLYLLAYLGVLCVTPFPGQYLRYLMPLAPVLALLAVLVLDSMSLHTRAVAAGMLPVLLAQGAVMIAVFAREYNPVSYVDASGNRIAYKLFFYDEGNREFDEVVDYLHQHAVPSEIVGAGTPHWIYLRTGLKAVMPPFESDPSRERDLLATVPVEYLVVGKDVVATERYTQPMVSAYPSEWTHLYATSGGHWDVYKRRRDNAATQMPMP